MSPLLCSVGAPRVAPKAIASATMPSIRPVALSLANLRPPAGSFWITELAAHMVSTGDIPWRNRPLSNSDSSASMAVGALQ